MNTHRFSFSRFVSACLCGAILAIGFLIPLAANAENNGIAPKPQMGWSSWSFLRMGVNDAKIRAQADGMHANLQAHGFQYVNIDDGWYLQPAQTVDQYGRWAVDTSLFPSGLSGVASYVHSLGLKFGTYLTPGIPVAAYNQNTPIQGTSYHARDIVTNTSTFQTNYRFSSVMYFIDYSKPGAQAFINSWANLLASWGVDYLKLDGVGDSTAADVQAWSQALNQSGRAIHFELSNSLDFNNGATWKQYANGWRTSGDIEAYGSSTLTNWNNVNGRFSSTPGWQRWGGPGGWNDLDSLEIGNGTTDGLTADERQSAESLWCMAASPLTLGTDLTHLDSGDLPLLTNDEVLGVDQSGVPGSPVAIGTTEVWRARQPDGTYAVALFNLGSTSANVTVTWSSIGFVGNASVRDLWAKSNLGTFANSYGATLNSHACKLLSVRPQIPATQYLADSSLNTLGGGATISGKNTGTSGDAVGFLGNGGTLQFNNVYVATAGTYNLTILYFNGDASRSANISINGGTAVSHTLNGTGGWSNLGLVTYQVTLAAGANTVAFSNPSGWAPDIDSITVQSTTIPSGNYYWVINRNSGKFVDVQNDSTTAGALILQYAQNNMTDQQWQIVSGGLGWYYLVNRHSNLQLDDPGASLTAGTQLIQQTPNTNPSQKWEFISAGGGYYSVLNDASSLVMDVSGNSLNNDAPIIQWTSNGQANQQWQLVPAP